MVLMQQNKKYEDILLNNMKAEKKEYDGPR